MTALLAFIRPRLLLAEGLLLVAVALPMSWAARRVAAWEQSFVARCTALRLLDAIQSTTATRSSKP